MTYKRILVALDGSELAERVLPYVEPLAEKFGSTLVLLRATISPAAVLAAEAPTGAVPVPIGGVDPTPIVEADRADAQRYLGGVAGPLQERGIAVQPETPEGDAAEMIVARARDSRADLIAMTTHGRGGLGRLVMGSVADEVLRSAPCPVLLVRVREEERDRT